MVFFLIRFTQLLLLVFSFVDGVTEQMGWVGLSFTDMIQTSWRQNIIQLKQQQQQHQQNKQKQKKF